MYSHCLAIDAKIGKMKYVHLMYKMKMATKKKNCTSFVRLFVRSFIHPLYDLSKRVYIFLKYENIHAHIIVMLTYLGTKLASNFI